MSTQPDETTGPTPPRPPYLVQRREDDGAILVGSVVWADDAPAAIARACDAIALQAIGSWQREAGKAVLDFLDAAEQRTQHADAVAAFPDDTPPPRRPAVQLRTEVDVAGVQVASLSVLVTPGRMADDPTDATQDAARALHDAALAVLRVLVVEPAEREVAR